MSESALHPTMSGNSVSMSETAPSSWSDAGIGDDFDYVPVSPWAPIALMLGLGGLAGFLGVFGLGVAFLGIFVGIAAVARVRSAAGAVKGTGFAVVGLTLSVLSFTLGTAKMVHAYQTEVPDGYQRVNFPKDIAEKQFVYYGPQRRLHPDVAPLIGTSVFLKGFMWQARKSEGLSEFVLLKDNGECCFGGSPKPYDMIYVRMTGDKTTPAFTGMVSVAGELSANVTAGESQPVYTIDADLVEEARTRF